MRFGWIRRPQSGGSYFKQARFEGWLRGIRVRLLPDGVYSGLELGFCTEGGSHFSTVIPPRQFEELAREMMAADAGAAIRAFGAAIQNVSVDDETGEIKQAA